MNVLLGGDIHAKIGREDMFKPAMGDERSH
jgi:hypothetical protein